MKRWPKNIKRINIPLLETDAYKAICKAEKMELPKYKLMGFEVLRYKGKDGFTTCPTVYITR